MNSIRLLWRLLVFAGYTAYIVAEIRVRKTFFGADMRASMRVRRRWARNLLARTGVRMTVEGEAPEYPCLVVANHRSYLDPILMLCDVPGFPVAKAELASWPVIGKGAALAGILYLRRDHSGSRLNILRQMEEKVREGFPVIIFPEGTTSGLSGTLPFKKGVFQLAARTGFPVVPVALIFADEADFWVGKESFLSHAARRFREKNIAVRVCYGPPLRSDSPDTLLDEAKHWIDTQLRP